MTSPIPPSKEEIEATVARLQGILDSYPSVGWHPNHVSCADIRTILSALSSAESRLEIAERKLKEARTPDIFGVDDMVVMADDLWSLELNPGSVKKIWANRHLGDRYVACRMGEDDEYEHDIFGTEAEAMAWVQSPASTSTDIEVGKDGL